jgi:hypothetical protein
MLIIWIWNKYKQIELLERIFGLKDPNFNRSISKSKLSELYYPKFSNTGSNI